MPQDAIESIDAAYDGDLEKKTAVERHLLLEDSPYPEVRAAVRNYDEEMPANTPRAWVLGMLWCTIGSGVNMLFSLRNPSIYLTPIVTLLLSYPVGLAWQFSRRPSVSPPSIQPPPPPPRISRVRGSRATD